MRRALVSLVLSGLLAGACSGTNPALKPTIGDTPQEENARLKAKLDSCERDRADTTRLEVERAGLKERLDAAEHDRDEAKGKLAESERLRLDAERRLSERKGR